MKIGKNNSSFFTFLVSFSQHHSALPSPGVSAPRTLPPEQEVCVFLCGRAGSCSSCVTRCSNYASKHLSDTKLTHTVWTVAVQVCEEVTVGGACERPGAGWNWLSCKMSKLSKLTFSFSWFGFMSLVLFLKNTETNSISSFLSSGVTLRGFEQAGNQTNDPPEVF